jgi:hypothetical protein
VTEHPVCIGLERPGDHVLWGQSVAGQNGLSAGSVGVSVIAGGISDRDVPRST